MSFFAPFRYGVSRPEVHEVDLKPFAYELRVPTTTVLSYTALFFTSSPEESESQLRPRSHGCDVTDVLVVSHDRRGIVRRAGRPARAIRYYRFLRKHRNDTGVCAETLVWRRGSRSRAS